MCRQLDPTEQLFSWETQLSTCLRQRSFCDKSQDNFQPQLNKPSPRKTEDNTQSKDLLTAPSKLTAEHQQWSMALAQPAGASRTTWKYRHGKTQSEHEYS